MSMEIENKEIPEQEYPPGTAKFLSSSTMFLIKAPAPTLLLIPVAVVAFLLFIGGLIFLKKDFVNVVTVPGKLFPSEMSLVKALTDVTISENMAKIGQKVSKSQVLATVEGGGSIFANSSGTFVRRFFNPGDSLRKGSTLAIVNDLNSEWIVRIVVPEKELSKLKIGQAVMIQIEQYPELDSLEGSLAEVVSYSPLDSTSGVSSATFLVRLSNNSSAQDWLNHHEQEVFGAGVNAVIITGRSTASEKFKEFLLKK